ncbi:single-stranded DNA-binding protein [Pseudoxanthomonas winnipegensis]|uniref:Single-stranded DNA-binding protein n=1 Tax=Pseudoxanthomonas winnipegensis TaxID=2480810 RepID=A0A4V2HFG9_9GAMM|nr:single-stranded DNA-binding protein [Pseudoxanthomonas winnipegensis]TAA37561.1 single-stranded DNA-binding protein [Pseudoxanthomonas winnipegensis]
MNAKVTILSSHVEEREGSFDNDRGESIAYTTRKQKAKLETGGFAYPIDIRLDKGQRAWPVGEYTMDLAEMLQVRNNAISLSKFAVLTPLAKA